jgi:hypothetical protein
MLQIDRNIDRTGPRLPVIGLGVLTLAGVMASSSPLVVLACGIVLILAIVLLWRPGQFPILLVPVSLQFIAVALKPITTAFTNSSLNDLAEFNISLEPAAFFGLSGIAALALGLRIGAGDPPASAKNTDTEDWSFQQIIILALASIFVGHAFDLMAGTNQIILALSGVKSAGIFVLAYYVLKLRRGLLWLAGMVIPEAGISMTGFFAGGFRDLAVVLLFAALMAQDKLRARSIVALGMGATVVFIVAVFWESGKQDYRAFLNEGTGAQVVLVPLDERLAYLAVKASDFDSQKFAEGFENLLKRVGYIDYLAATMERVPEVLPYEGGAHLAAAVWHILTPRILFPDKPALESDSSVTAYYTGLENVVFADENTSISIGYLGELYIDFSIGGALFVVLLIGLAFGRCYRIIRDYGRTALFVNYGLCIMIVMPLSIFEISLVKLVGSLVAVLAAALVLQRLIWPFLPSFLHVKTRPTFDRGAQM